MFFPVSRFMGSLKNSYLKMHKSFILPALFILILSCNPTSNQIGSDTTYNLVGTWKFAADQLLDSNYNVIKEDTAVDGLLIYTAEGKMSVQFIWKDRRGPVMGDSIMKQDGFSAGLGLGNNTWSHELSRLFIDTYEGYFGNYEIDNETNTVSHILSGSLRPDKAGTVKKRIFKLQSDSLFLRSADADDRWGVLCVRVR